jgi:hypothetical protein
LVIPPWSQALSTEILGSIMSLRRVLSCARMRSSSALAAAIFRVTLMVLPSAVAQT